MDSPEIIKSINKIYDRFQIPPNLRMHMFRVAAVAQIICDNWTGTPLNKQDIVAICLLHDLGNIAKVKSASPFNIKMFGDKLDYWMEVKEKITKKYGNDPDEATVNMIKELGVNQKILSILTIGNDLYAANIIHLSTDIELKIFAYSDDRVGPFGILSLKERMADVLVRYSQFIKENFTAEQMKVILDHVSENEKLLFKSVSITPEQIDDKKAQPYIKKYQNGT